MNDETSATVPVFDEGHGEDHIKITVRSGDLTTEALTASLQVLARSRVPFQVVLAVDGPPLLYVTVAEAARTLGVNRPHVEALIRTGWLRPVYWQGEDIEPGQRMVTMAVAEETGIYQGWRKVIPWADVIEVFDHGLKKGHLPSVDRAKPGTTRLRRELSGRKGRKYGTAQVARRVLMDAKDPETGEQQWMNGPAIFNAVEDFIHSKRPSQPVRYNTVRDAIATEGVRKGYVERRDIGYRKDDPLAKAEFRWVADTDWMERPQGRQADVEIRTRLNAAATRARIAAIEDELAETTDPVEKLRLMRETLDLQEDLL